MNYEYSRPIGGTSSGTGLNCKSQDTYKYTVFMTFEQLQRTWMSKKKREQL